MVVDILLRRIKKMIIGSIDWFLYTFLNTKQKQFIANLFSDKQKDKMKKVIKPGKKRAQMKRIERTKYRLYNLGFTEKGLADLHAHYNQDEDLYLRRRAAWELAVYHANLYSEDGAENCLHFIEQATNGVTDEDELRRAAILKAESYDILEEKEKAKNVISNALASKAHADLYLAQANLESSDREREKRINQAYRLYNIANIRITESEDFSAYDRMQTQADDLLYNNLDNSPKVTVIIPAYNSEGTIQTALNAMLNQTWMNLEILVVDDNSTDNTKQVIANYAEKDNRINLLTTEKNSGAYTARNEALKVATGDFVTINDADDWSHPEKIKTQVQHLINNPKVIGNFSNQARATERLKFYRRGKPGIYIFPNMSSFMFRRQPVMDKLGYWDSVRFAGDSEFVKRVKLVFGEKAIVNLPTAPLSFQRQSEDSLTGSAAFGFPGYFMGVRKEYAEAHEHYHNSNRHNLYYPFPQNPRPFPVPEPMLPIRERKPNGRRHFDVIIASEFRLLGGTNMSNIEEIKAQKKLGLKTGLIQMSRYDLNSVTEVNPNVRDLIDGDDVQMLVYGEKVSCDVLIVRHPPILQDWQKYIPEIEANHVRVIVNQPPKREYSENGETLYDIPRCVEQLEGYVGKKGKWYPIGPLIRETLYEHHAKELKSIELADEDWVNIINVEEWRRPQRPDNKHIRIGRHSRDQYVKWPIDQVELRSIYPEDEKYEIHVLGGAKAPEKVLGQLPANWHVHEFGEVLPKEFLADLDVFVYYTHPEWVEAFGRVIFEAMAVGVPVIIPPNYQALFGDAAIYAEAHEVKSKIHQLMHDDYAYQAQVEKAQTYVEKHFGYSKHASRIEECLHEG